jgi:hypothetical protein
MKAKMNKNIFFRIDIHNQHITVFLPNKTYRLPENNFRRIKEISHSYSVLTSTVKGCNYQLIKAGSELWDLTFGESDFSHQQSQKIYLNIKIVHPINRDRYQIPWECLVEPNSQFPVAWHQDFVIYRTDSKYASQSIEDAEENLLRILIIAPNTRSPKEKSLGGMGCIGEKEIPELASEEEINLLRGDLNDLEIEGLADIKVLGPDKIVTLEDIRIELEENSPHVVHYIGHSHIVKENDKETTHFLLNNQDGSFRCVAERLFLNLFLHLNNTPRLLVLNSCFSSGSPISAGLQQKILSLGTKAVLAMRSKVFDFHAREFANIFYKILAQGESIGIALQKARYHLFKIDDKSAGYWILPVLYSLEANAKIIKFSSRNTGTKKYKSVKARFDVPKIKPSIAINEPPLKGLMPYGDQDEAGFFGREEITKQVISYLKENKNLILYGESGIGKTSFLRAAIIPLLRSYGFVPIYASYWKRIIDELLERMGYQLSEDEKIPSNILFDSLDSYLGTKEKGQVVLILDQVEDSLLYEEYEQLLTGILARLNKLFILFSIRKDALPWFSEKIASATSIKFYEIEMPQLDKKGAEKILYKLHNNYGLKLEKKLETRFLQDITFDIPFNETQHDVPIQLSLFSLTIKLLHQKLGLTSNETILKIKDYEELGAIRQLLSNHLKYLMRTVESELAEAAKRILVQIVKSTNRGTAMLTEVEIARQTGLEKNIVHQALEYLHKNQIISKKIQGGYALVHEILIKTITKDYIPDEIARQNIAHANLNAHKQYWKMFGTPLLKEQFELINSFFDKLDLSGEELAVYFSTACSIQYSYLKEQLASLPDEKIRTLISCMWNTGLPEIMAHSLYCADLIPPHRRGTAPFHIDTRPDFARHGRFLSESLLPDLAQKALAIPTPDNQSEEQLQKDKKYALELLDKLKKRQFLNDVNILPYLETLELIGFRFDGFGTDKKAGLFSPGLSFDQLLFLCLNLLCSIPVSWCIWPNNSLNPLQLLYFIGFIFALVVPIGCAAHINLLYDTLKKTLKSKFAINFRYYPWRFKPWGVIKKSTIAFAIPILLLTIISISNWLHEYIFISSLPDIVIQWMQSIPFDIMLILKSLFSLGIHLFKFVGWCFLGMVQILGIGIVLAPPILFISIIYTATDRKLYDFFRTRSAASLFQAGIALIISWYFLQPACLISYQLLYVIKDLLMYPDFFYGENGINILLSNLKSLSESHLTSIFALIFPLFSTFVIRILSIRTIRFYLGVLDIEWRDSSIKAEMLRPLIAERSRESFNFILKLIKKYPGLRTNESFSFLYYMAINHNEIFGEDISNSDRKIFSMQAQELLKLFSKSEINADTYLKDIMARNTIPNANELKQIIEKIPDTSKIVQKSKFKQNLKTGWEAILFALGSMKDTTAKNDSKNKMVWKPGFPNHIKNHSLRRIVTAVQVFFLALLFAAAGHILITVFRFIINFFFPINEPIGSSFWDMALTISIYGRIMELAVSFFVVFSLDKLYSHFRNKWKSKVNSRRTQ